MTIKSILSKLLRTPVARIAAGLFFLNYLQAAITFLLNLWVANLLGESGYGVLSMGLVAATLLSTVVNFGSDTTLVRDLTHSQARDDILLASITLRSIVSIVAVLGCVAWLALDPSMDGIFLPVLLCSLTGVATGLSPKGWYDFRYRMHTQAAIACFEKLLYGVLLVVFFYSKSFQASPLGVASCLLATRVLGFALQWGIASKSWSPSKTQLKENVRWLFYENIWVFGAALGNVAAPYINQLALARQDGVEDLAQFFICFQIMAVVQLMQQLFARLLAPRIAEVTQDGSPVHMVRSRLIRFLGYSSVASLSLIVPLFFVGPYFIRFALPEEFHEGLGAFRILLMWCVAYGLGLVTNQFLICLRLNRYFFSLSVSKGVLAILLGQLLIPRFGGNGVAATLVICSTLFVALQVCLIWNKTAAASGSAVQ